MKKLLFIFNPTAGKAQIINKFYSIIDFYTKRDYLVTTMSTSMLGEFADVLREAPNYFDAIVCAGGDGTLNGVISCCMETGCAMPIGYLPMGSTNDFAKTLGYSMDLTQALEKSCIKGERFIDIGRFNNRYFVYVAAFGSLAEVSYSTSQEAKNILGHFAYLLKGIQKVTDLKAYQLTLECNDQIVEGEFCIGFVMNSLSIGGFRNPVSEFVILDDGLFEVLLVRMPKNLNELQQIILDLINQKITSEMLVYMQTGHLKIRSNQMEWSLDGEFGGSVSEVEIWNCRQAIRIIGNQEVN